MILTVLAVFLPLFFLLRGLRHGLYVLHLCLLCGISWWRFPSISYYPLFHPYYPYFLGMVHLCSINLLTLLAYGWDKRQAVQGGWRIPEKTLHAMALIGGTIGAFAGSRIFRHKTIKKQFRQMFWLISAIQIALMVALGLMQ